ncbi:hypothetical protein [Niabella drilacis]|nr:hypothetical protein [Niabella drilacis]
MKKALFLLCGLTLIALHSCSIFEKSEQRRKSVGISRQNLYTTQVNGRILPTLFWAHYDATQRGGLYLAKEDGTVKVISENPPDAALNSTINVLVKANVAGKIDAAAKFSAVKSVAELGKKNAANYMIRDLAFRIESLQNNASDIDDNILKTYNRLIDAAEKISIAETQASISASRNESWQTLMQLIKLSKDTLYRDLKLDLTFFKTISKQIEE